MASSKEFLEYILEQLSELEEITYRAMMGEYIIYYKGRIAGGIYDDRLLIKPVKSIRSTLWGCERNDFNRRSWQQRIFNRII